MIQVEQTYDKHNDFIDGYNITMHVPYDVTPDEMVQYFFGIMSILSFLPTTTMKAMKDFVEDYINQSKSIIEDN